MNDPGSSRQVALPSSLTLPSLSTSTPFSSSTPPSSSNLTSPPALPSFTPASQAQIIRAHQRDASHISRLAELASEIVRSLAGTRWLAHKQTVIDVSVRAAYLILTLGRGRQTLGEEYTDVMPFRVGGSGGRTPGKSRRLLTILFLLSPTLLASPSFLSTLRSTSSSYQPTDSGDTDVDSSSSLPFRKSILHRLIRLWHLAAIAKWRHRLADLVESPLGQSMPELHMVAFLYGGRFFEWGRRLTGLGYISTQAPNPDRSPASFEPLALLLGIPLLYRLFPRHLSAPTDSSDNPTAPTVLDPSSKPMTKALDPTLDPDIDNTVTTSGAASGEETLLLSKTASYDTPNTYLTPEAIQLPERQCTLCLEPRGTGKGSGGTVGVTECGHIFCWGCLGGLEKVHLEHETFVCMRVGLKSSELMQQLECPLCRQSLRMERLIAAYNL